MNDNDNNDLSYSDDDNPLITHVVTPTEMMTTGLTIMGYIHKKGYRDAIQLQTK